MINILIDQKQIFLKEYSATLLQLSDTKMVNRTLCDFLCECGNSVSIQYRLILKRGAYCSPCCYKHSYEKRLITVNNESYDNPRIVYTLKKISERDNCTILNFNKHLSYKSIINFKCKCGTNDSTLYRNIKIRGGICRTCCCKIGNNKRVNTFMEVYGTTHSSNTPEIIEKTRNTNMERYGTIYPSQSPYVNCNTYKSKKYTTKSGKIHTIQGYENIALDELMNIYSEDNIIIGKSNVPKIKYIFENKNKVYYPDIYIPTENKIIEVKSTWTYKVQVNRNVIKANACKEQGFNYEFWIYDINKNKITLIH